MHEIGQVLCIIETIISNLHAYYVTTTIFGGYYF
jgi:hypothetical protein